MTKIYTRNYSKLLLLLLVFMSVNSGLSKVITPQEALDRFRSYSAHDTRATSKDYKLSYSAFDDGGNNAAYYVFTKSSDQGFVVLSADDRLKPLLGYTDSGSFDFEKLPEDLKWFLNGYKREISYALKNGLLIQAPDIDTRSEVRSAIEPMIKTKWDQGINSVTGDAYNNKCPRIGNKKCFTGCVPTAMAQIMNYHKWPETHGSGSWEYTWSYDQNGTSMTRELSFDFENKDFDWNNMLVEYTGDANDRQKDAVATLMYACGVALEASYGVNETGAYSFIVPDVLRTYFGYDSMIKYLKRDFFSADEWENIIYKELSEGRPVQYGGYTKEDGGHSFVCDGYDGDGLYHINWGWGGMSDGYFSLSALNPTNQGTGSYDGGYNYGQDAIIGIQPSTGSDQVFSLLYVLKDSYDKSGSFEIKSLPDIDGNLTFSFPNGWLTNNSLFTHTYELGVKVSDANGNEIGIMNSISGELKLDGYKRGNMMMDWGIDQLLWDYSFKTSAELYYDLKEGSYTLMPVYKTSEMDWNQLYTDAEPHTATITIGESGIDVTESDNLKICAFGKSIRISGAPINETVKIYTITGELIATEKTNGDQLQIKIDDSGIYIVKCGTKVMKIRIR